MTYLADLLANPDRLLKPLKVRAPELTLLPRAVAKVSGVARELTSEGTEALQARVAATVKASGVQALSRSDLRQACRVYLHPPHAPARDPEIAEPLCDEVVRLRRRSAFYALMDAYLDGFEPEDEAVVELAQRLSKANKRWPWRKTDLWPDRIGRFDLLNPAKAPQSLAKAVLASDAPYRSLLDEAGLTTEGRRSGGLALSAFSAACESVRRLKGTASLTAQDRLLEWSGEPGPLVYAKAWPQFAGALFEPWQGSEPYREHKTRIMERALAHAGDPRINRTRWRPVEDAAGAAYATILRWLTQASVRQFFDIVSETMTDRPDMWAERRAFWTRYLDAEHISAAWVAFGSDGAHRADRAATVSQDKSLSMFGRLGSGNGRSAQHAALIMRIGDLTIAEWSHNGRWNIWTRGDANAPDLFRHNTRRWPDYEPSELMYAPTAGSHTSGWQFKVAQIIRDQTGLRA